VELQVALDEAAGTATLTWTPYEGEVAFGEYWVLRNVARQVDVDTLDRIVEPRTTVYVDSNLQTGTAYEYRVSAVNASGFASPSALESIPGYQTHPVELLSGTASERAGTITLTWSRFVGPDFVGYEVHRRRVGTDQDSAFAPIASAADTTLADSSLYAGVEYAYTVVVQTTDGPLWSNQLERRLRLPAVELELPLLSSKTASAEAGLDPVPRSAICGI